MKAEINLLGEPEREENGRLKFSYCKKAFPIIMKYSREGFAQVTKDMVNKRRQLLKDNKMDEYKILFFELDKREESFAAEMVH